MSIEAGEAVRDTSGEVVRDFLGGSVEHEPLSRDDEFVLSNLELALRLHYTVGMQELRRGAGTPDPRFARRNRAIQTSVTELIGRADHWFNLHFQAMTDDERDSVSRELLGWTNGMPPLGADFSDIDRKVLQTYDDSPLVNLYAQYLPQ